MGRRKKKSTPPCTCTPNCIYFQQELHPNQVLSETIEEGGVRTRKVVKRDCLYDGTQIKSWGHMCGRKVPCYIHPPVQNVNTGGNV